MKCWTKNDRDFAQAHVLFVWSIVFAKLLNESNFSIVKTALEGLRSAKQQSSTSWAL